MYSNLATSQLVSTLVKAHPTLGRTVIRLSSHNCSTCLKRRSLLRRNEVARYHRRRSSTFGLEPEKLTSFVKDLFIAKINMDWVFPFPTLENSRDLNSFNENLKPLYEFLQNNEINSPKLDAEAEIPNELIQELKKLRLFGMKIPQEYDGLGLTNLKLAKYLEEIATADMSVNMMLASHNLLGAQPILKFGNEQQKQKYLPKLATGEMIAAFCSTEACSGSDINTIETRARLSEDGKSWILTGEKTSINNGAIADVMIVFAKIEVTDADGSLADTIGAFIVERGFGGVYNGPQEQKMGMRALNTCDVMFDETPVPLENMLGEERDGFKIATETLNDARLGLVCGVLGPLRNMVRDASTYADLRMQFGKRIKDFELVKDRLFRMAQNIYAAESVVYLTLGKYDQAVEEDKVPDLSVESAIAKIFCAQKALETANDCVDLFGHKAYTNILSYERLLRDTKMLTLSEGTEDVLKLYIALSCFKHSQNYVVKRMRELKKGSLRFWITWLMDRLRDEFGAAYVHKGLLRKRIPSFGVSEKSQTKTWFDRRLERSGELFEKTVIGFYRKVFSHMRFFGNTLNDEQLRLRRFADMSIAMYSMIAVLARCNKSMVLGLRDYDREYLISSAYIHAMFRECGLMIEELQSHLGRSIDEHSIRVGRELLEERRYAIAHPLELEHKYIENPIYLKHFQDVLKSLPK